MKSINFKFPIALIDQIVLSKFQISIPKIFRSLGIGIFLG